jgi:hypothetical protein
MLSGSVVLDIAVKPSLCLRPPLSQVTLLRLSFSVVQSKQVDVATSYPFDFGISSSSGHGDTSRNMMFLGASTQACRLIRPRTGFPSR